MSTVGSRSGFSLQTEGWRTVLIGLTALVALGCAGTRGSQVQLADKAPLYVEGVPFYPQLEAQCGPASLAAVLNYWGKQVSPEQIAHEIYVPRLKGSLSLDLWRYARTQNFDATIDRGSLEYLHTHLLKNEPIVASLNLGYRLLPLGHYLVVVGLDPDERMVIAYSGTERNSRIPFDQFLSAWQKTGYWALLVKPVETTQRDKKHQE
jgi:ABC-type bacteriocin/lantibiotic exporter with double-glycine peptidase domain